MKVRIKFSKLGNIRFVGHLDLMRYFQKAHRRAELPVAYSEGFSPHQIMSFAAPLGMGTESLAEYYDLRLTDEAGSFFSSDLAVRALNRQMAEGVEILSFLRLPDGAGNCMSAVRAADYRLLFPEAEGDEIFFSALSEAAGELFARREIPVVKKAKKGGERSLDIRPMIFALSAERNALFMRVSQGSEANLKPELLLKALCGTAAGEKLLGKKTRLLRTELYDAEFHSLESYGERIE